jgi:hypothetical protein
VIYRRHIKRCQKNNGKNVKDIKLDKISQPYIPHILSNKLYLNSVLNKTEYEYTKNYIIYDFETAEVRVNKKFGDKSELISELVPPSVSCVVYNEQTTIKKFFSIRFDINFIDNFIEYLFNISESMKKPNIDYEEEDNNNFKINRDYINVIGFNSAKFDFILLLQYLQNDK